MQLKIKLSKESNSIMLMCLIVLFLYAVILFEFLCIIPVVIHNIVILILGSFSLLLCVHVSRNCANKNIIVFLLIYTVQGFLSFMYNHNADLIELLWPLGYMSIGIAILRIGIDHKFAKYSYYTLSVCLSLMIILNDGIDNMRISTSSNFVSTFAVLIFSIFMISCIKSGISISVFDLFPFILMCFVGIGRSGVLLSVFTFLGVIVINWYEANTIDKIINFIIIGIFATCLVCVLWNGYIIEHIVAITNIIDRGLTSIRTKIWMDYLKTASDSLLDIIWGANISGTPLLNSFSGNLHNSFLMLHAKYGLLSVLLVMFMLFRSFIIGIRTKNNYYVLLLLLVVFRANLDYTNFNSTLDVIMPTLLFYNGFCGSQ